MAGRFTVEAIFKGVDRVTKPVRRMQANVQKFTRGAIRGLKAVGRAAAFVGRTMRKGFTAGFKIAGIAVAATALLVRQFTKEADDLAKQSRLLDFDIEQLQLWKFAAGQAGLSTENFDKALEGFLKRTGEARAGTGSMITLLKQQNPELLKNIIATKTSAEAFELLIEGLRNTEGATNKLALANAAGGRSASKLILLAKLDRKEREKLFAEMRENGVITKIQAKLAEDLTDAWTSMTLAMKGFRNDVLEPLLPMLTEAAGSIRQWAIDNKGLVSGKFKDFLKFVVNNFSAIVDEAKFFIKVALWIVGVVFALKGLVLVLTVINLVMAANPVVLIVLAIILAVGLLVTAIINIIDNWEQFDIFFRRIWGNIKNFFSDTVTFFVIQWDRVSKMFTRWMDDMRKDFPALFAFIDPIIDATIGKITKAIELAKTLINSVQESLGLGAAEDAVNANRTVNEMISVAPQIAAHVAQMTPEQLDELSPAERVALGIPPKSESSASATITIQDATGRAEITDSGTSGDGAAINLVPSGDL